MSGLMKKALLGAAVVLGLAAGSANAATFNIAFTLNGVGDGQPDAFGTFETLANGGVTSFSAQLFGITYDTLFGGSSFDASQLRFVGYENYFAETTVTTSPTPTIRLDKDGLLYFGTCNLLVNGSSCTFGGGYDGFINVSAVSEVPLPAALPLLAAGLGAMGFMGWRRKRRAA